MFHRVFSNIKPSRLLVMLSASLIAFPQESHAANIFNGIGNGIMGAINGAANVLLGMGIGQINAAINGLLAKILGVGSCSGNGTISDIFCNIMDNASTVPGFITAMAYVLGIIFAVVAIFKLKDHVLNPTQTPLSDSMKRFVAGGALFSLPTIIKAAQDGLTGGDNAMSEVSGYAGNTAGGYGLDTMMVALFSDIYAPLMSLIFAFAYVAGLVLVFIGISRLIKTSQDGPRGPAGLGTIMCFIIAGVLFSLSTIMGAFSTSMFLDNTVSTFAVLQTTTGDAVIDEHILAIISTVLVFMTIVGFISFLRGFFILRDVAEGNGQASLMAAVTIFLVEH